jgi:uncharacterized membrane protein (UPF0182 family)
VSFRPSGPARPPAGRAPAALLRWPRLIAAVLATLVAIAVIVAIVAGIWTDYLWFGAVHYSSVFGITYGTRWAMFFVTGLFMVLVVGANAVLAYRLRPIYQPAPAADRASDAYRMAIDPHRRLLLGALLAAIGLIAGVTGAGAWRTWLLFVNQVPFPTTDPQFHMNLSFFVFTYPFIRLVLGYLFAAVLLSLLMAAGVHYLYGGLRLQGRRPRVTMAAQAHLFLLFGVFVLLKAVSYWFDRYGIDFSQRGTVTTGASYTDVNAVLPAKTVLAVIAILCALLFFAGAARRSAMLPAVGFGLLVLSAILIGGLYPAIIQQFVVKPNELAKESPYIQREINSTRQAYGITAATTAVQPYLATSTEPAAALGDQVAALPGLRLLDPDVVSPTFQQLQQVKSYYQFPDTLAMDRYRLPGDGPLPQDTVVAVRGMGGPPAGQANWINTHLVYTHGFGFVAASANRIAPNGNPAFTESQIPPRGALRVRQPRVYFGQQENSYAIVGGTPGGHREELDYPTQNGAGQQNTTYEGHGGVAVGSPLRRLLYAVKFRELNILLSGAINGRSQILYDREPLARVAKIAPFLTLDGETYPVAADGQIWWVVDGYTSTDLYPYAQRLGLAQATATSDAPGGSVAGQAPGQINYLRNSVKAVMNAYTGRVTLYAWDPADPILRAWMRAFPGVIQPKSAIPAELLRHLRYPPDLFEVQRQVLTQYHVTQAQSFYGGQNFWAVPNEPGSQPGSQPPYYQTMTMPGAPTAFSLTTSLVQRGRQNLAAFAAVDSDPLSAGYGTIRVLQVPQDTAILGPQQVQSTFESDPTVSQQLSLYRQNGSKVIEGNLITLPVGGTLIYEEPIYIQAAASGGSSTSGSYPVLKRVAVSFDGNVGFGATLAEALQQVVPGYPGATGAAPGGSGGGGSGGGAVSGAVRGYLAQAEADYARAQAALAAGHWGQYGSDLAAMKAALDKAQHAAQASPAPSPAASPSGSPRASPSRSPRATPSASP